MAVKLTMAGSLPISTLDGSSSAYHVLGAATHGEAIAVAMRILERAPRCGCCISHRVHLSRYVGTLLFYDDAPSRLVDAIPASERTEWSERLFAACIVLHGRARVFAS
jgi:hypothetical protein